MRPHLPTTLVVAFECDHHMRHHFPGSQDIKSNEVLRLIIKKLIRQLKEVY